MRIQRVLVAGAGLAGLSAANQLAEAGIAVTVVEARDRLGGRAWTIHHPFVDGAFGELGAEFIDDDHPRMRRLAKRLGVETVRVLKGGFTQRYRDEAGSFELRRTSGWAELGKALAPLVHEYDAAHGASDSDRVRELSTYSVKDWLRQSNAPAHVQKMAEVMRGFFLADPDDLSALPLAAELSQGDAAIRTPMHRIVGGTGRLVTALATATNARWILNHRLRAITQTVDGVVAEIADESNRLQQIEADAAVITLPATTLRDVIVTPSLPEDQWHAVRSLLYGCATKGVIQTSADVFGGRPARAFATDMAAGAFWDAAEGQPAGTAIISFLAGGAASSQLTERLRESADVLLSDLCWLARGGESPRAVASAHWRWEHDPLARGGYAYIDPGFDAGWLPLLGRRAGRLVFAGEHTSADHQGYMEGAVDSADRVVRELLSA